MRMNKDAYAAMLKGERVMRFYVDFEGMFGNRIRFIRYVVSEPFLISNN